MIRNVVMIGTGKLAQALSPVLLENGIHIMQFFSRELTHAQNLADQFNTDYTNNWNELNRVADLYIICVKDDAISEVSEAMSKQLDHTANICHTSGSRGIEAISTYFTHRACMWPMQSFTFQSKIIWPEVPIFLSGTDSILNEIEVVCKKFSKKVFRIDEEKKKWVHVAAVFANNFSNYNLSITEKILDSCGVPLEVMEPMMQNMIRNVFTIGPGNTQSGPANRGDRKTMEMQQKMLADKFPEYENLYQLYSEIISQKK